METLPNYFYTPASLVFGQNQDKVHFANLAATHAFDPAMDFPPGTVPVPILHGTEYLESDAQIWNYHHRWWGNEELEEKRNDIIGWMMRHGAVKMQAIRDLSHINRNNMTVHPQNMRSPRSHIVSLLDIGIKELIVHATMTQAVSGPVDMPDRLSKPMPIDVTRLDLKSPNVQQYIFTPKINGTRVFLIGMKGQFYFFFPDTEEVRHQVLPAYVSKIGEQELLILDGELCVQPTGDPSEAESSSHRRRASSSELDRFVHEIEIFVPCDPIAVAGYSCVGMSTQNRTYLLTRCVDALNGLTPNNLSVKYMERFRNPNFLHTRKRVEDCDAHQAAFVYESLQVYQEMLSRIPPRDAQTRVSVIVNKPFVSAREIAVLFSGHRDPPKELRVFTRSPDREGLMDTVPMEDIGSHELSRIPFAEERKNVQQQQKQSRLKSRSVGPTQRSSASSSSLSSSSSSSSSSLSDSTIPYQESLYMPALNRTMNTDGVVMIHKRATFQALYEGRSLLKYKWPGSNTVDVLLCPDDEKSSSNTRPSGSSSFVSIPSMRRCKFACRFPKRRRSYQVIVDGGRSKVPCEPLVLIARCGTVSNVSSSFLEVIKSRLLSHLPPSLYDFVWDQKTGIVKWDLMRSSIAVIPVRFDKNAGRWVMGEDEVLVRTQVCADAVTIFTALVTSELFQTKESQSVLQQLQTSQKSHVNSTTNRYTQDVHVHVLSINLRTREITMGYRLTANSGAWQADYRWIVEFQYKALRDYLEIKELAQADTQSTDLQTYIEVYHHLVRCLPKNGKMQEKESSFRVIGAMQYPTLNILQHRTQQQQPQRLICSLHLDPHDRTFHVKEMRSDKETPNSLLTIFSVLQSHLCNITTREFFETVRSAS